MAFISDFSLDFVREPLQKPFGFKGGFLSELWQVICSIRLDNGRVGSGLGVQSVLWSDEVTFCASSQMGGNAMMFSVTEYALKQLRGLEFTSPADLQHRILDSVHDYAKKVTGNPELPRTFSLNAMVAVDFALWQLWAQENGASNLDDVAREFCPELSEKQSALGEIPLLSYQTSEQEIRRQLDDGAFLLKIKIGSNPGGRNDPEEMCRWDAQRLRQIHEIARSYETPYTECGHPVYYLDANGRYPSRELLMQFLGEAEVCGALERIVLLEEPFAEDNLQDASNIPVRVAGDESAHCAQDAVKLIEQYHYGAIALKPIAKTLSASLEIYREAHRRGIPCFCADLTVPPAMLEWNMQVASRIPALPGLKIGVVESNGPQNYIDWQLLKKRHPIPDAPWLTAQDHVFHLSKEFYTQCAAFLPLDAYTQKEQ